MTDETAELTEQALRFDSLREAEKVTGHSYKEDEATSRLGLMLHLHHGEAKRELLEAMNDTYYSSTFARAVGIAADLGFEQVDIEHFTDDKGYKDIHLVSWHPDDGILLTMESYSGWADIDKESSLNSANIHFNWEPETHEEDFDGRTYTQMNYQPSYSGRWVDGVVAGDVDVREGLRHILGQMRVHGRFLNPWRETPSYLHILHRAAYPDWRKTEGGYATVDKVLKQRREARLSRLPKSLRTSMGL